MHLLSLPCIAMASVNLYVGVHYLFFYWKRPQIREHLPFALLCLSVALYDIFAAALYNSTSLPDGIFWQRLQLDSVFTISIFLIWFTSVFTEQKGNRVVQFAIGLFIALFLVSSFAGPELTLSVSHPAIKNIEIFNRLQITYYEGTVGPIYQMEIITAILAYLYICYLLIRHYGRTHYRLTLLILSCQIVYFFGVLNDSLIATQVYPFVYLSEYSFFFIILAMAYTLLDRFVNLHVAFEDLNVNLEHKILERTREVRELNEELKRLAERDGLTGVYNRRFFNEYFEIELKRARGFLEHRSQLEPVAGNAMNFGLALIDIDHFKQVNDRFGHLVGDAAIMKITEIIEQNIFSRDVLCRYGGEEFALLLTKTAPEGLYQAAEKIRREIDEHAFVFEANPDPQHITVSIGLVDFEEVRDRKSAEILKLADDRLYRAKNLGRNRIVHTNSD